MRYGPHAGGSPRAAADLLGLAKHLGRRARLILPDLRRVTEPLPFDDDDENADVRVRPG
jgi:hypothetical protein